jgi:hypothetical protein
MPQGKFFFVDDDGFAVTKAERKAKHSANARDLKQLPLATIQPRFFTFEELRDLPVGDAFIFDVESYWNYFLVAFKHVKSGKVVCIEDSPEQVFNVDFCAWMMGRFLLIGFNSEEFDLTVLTFALRLGYGCEQLKEVVCRLIEENERASDLLRESNLWIANVNHIDLMEVCPLQGSLKKYAAKLHCKRMQELPYPPSKHLTREEAYNVMLYCINDLDNTELLYRELADEIKLREELGKQYNLELRSKSDAQIAEAIISKEVAKVLGRLPKKDKVEAGHTFRYEPPAFLQFQTEFMRDKFEALCQLDFEVTETGYVDSEGLAAFEFQLGDSVYKMGRGGLHSKEKSVSYKATADWSIVDDDVESYYPRLILNSRMFPKNMGEAFLAVYNELVESRIRDKKAKNTSLARTAKRLLLTEHSASWGPNGPRCIRLTC